MEFHEVVRTRRSVRAYRPDPIPDESLARVLEAGRLSPSANDVQPWRVAIVRKESTRREIARFCYEQDFIAQAPVVLVIAAEQESEETSTVNERMCLVDTAIFIEHLALAARAEGLGTCWIGAFDLSRQSKIKRLLRAGPNLHLIMVMPLGFPASRAAFRAVAERKPLEAIAFNERFDSPITPIKP